MYDFWDSLKKFFTSRLFVLGAFMVACFSLLIVRVFYLQVIKGAYFEENFELQINTDITLNAARGNIYDCNGNLLAYNELAYSVVISDIFESSRTKNEDINDVIYQVIVGLEKNGDALANDFAISYVPEDDSFCFNVSGTTLERFLADTFGQASYDKLGYNKKFGFDESSATAEQVMNFLMHDDNKYQVDEEKYGREMAYKIVVVRNAISQNRYTRYKTSTIATDVSDATVAFINEHSDILTGVEIQEDTIRKYNDSEYFASLIGYTGKISQQEYDELSQKDESYTTNDVVGKSGLEQYYESYLRGINGNENVYIDNVGRIVEVVDSTKPKAGDDLYLSIDAELQKNTYLLLEQELAGIVYNSIKSGLYSSNDVYNALMKNNVVDISHFTSEDASENEKAIQGLFEVRQAEVVNWISQELTSANATVNKQMTEELLDYFTYIISMLKTNDVLVTANIDTNDEVYINWKNNNISPREYLNHCIAKQWVDITTLDVDEQYADSGEIYEVLCQYICDQIVKEKGFSKIILQYMVEANQIDGKTLCLILYDQNKLEYDKETVEALQNGSLTPYAFLMDKIKNIEITPAQLALDPCTGSVVLTDTKTGCIKALVSYPGYDNNRLANSVDSAYFAQLNDDLSKPQYNYATQEKTAPGSTFKMVISVAGLLENKIDTSTEINCTGVFDQVDNKPKCWNHSGHGNLNLEGAIKNSCNVFYYSVGYDMSIDSTGKYNEELGISRIQKYASIFGLDEVTGLEVVENQPQIADEYPVMAAIGQSNNNFTTVSLSRYVTSLVTQNVYDYQLMNRIVDSDGNVLSDYQPKDASISNIMAPQLWDTIYNGMRGVVEDLSCFDDFPVVCAGKTGTAQQIETRPNHALFVGYAPFDNPEITIATRISYGGSSHNAAQLARNVFAYYFQTEDTATLVDGVAEEDASAVTLDGTSQD